MSFKTEKYHNRNIFMGWTQGYSGDQRVSKKWPSSKLINKTYCLS